MQTGFVTQEQLLANSRRAAIDADREAALSTHRQTLRSNLDRLSEEVTQARRTNHTLCKLRTLLNQSRAAVGTAIGVAIAPLCNALPVSAEEHFSEWMRPERVMPSGGHFAEDIESNGLQGDIDAGTRDKEAEELYYRKLCTVEPCPVMEEVAASDNPSTVLLAAYTQLVEHLTMQSAVRSGPGSTATDNTAFVTTDRPIPAKQLRADGFDADGFDDFVKSNLTRTNGLKTEIRKSTETVWC